MTLGSEEFDFQGFVITVKVSSGLRDVVSGAKIRSPRGRRVRAQNHSHRSFLGATPSCCGTLMLAIASTSIADSLAAMGLIAIFAMRATLTMTTDLQDQSPNPLSVTARPLKPLCHVPEIAFRTRPCGVSQDGKPGA